MSFVGAAWAASSAALAAAVFLVIHKKEGEARRQQRGIPWFFGPWLLRTLLRHFLGHLRLFFVCLSLRILRLLIGIGLALLLALVLLLPRVRWTPFAAGRCASYDPAAGFRVFGTGARCHGGAEGGVWIRQVVVVTHVVVGLDAWAVVNMSELGGC